MHVTKLLLLAASLTLLAAIAPETHVYDVARYGAKCDAVTTGNVRTTLSRAASAGADSVSMSSVANVVAGAQIYLDPLTSSQEIRYVKRVAGSLVTFTEPLKLDHQAAAPVYGSGGYVAGTDDTIAINAAFAAASRDGAGTVRFPGAGGTSTGKCAISGPLNASTSGLTVAGAGMHESTIVAMPNFDYDPARTPRGLDGQYVGMLWTDLPVPPPARGISPPQPPLQHVTIHDLGLDPRAGTQKHFYRYNAISGFARAIQYFTVRNVYFELGAPLSWTDTTKPFTGINYIVLSYDPANSSHDLLFDNIEAHNGVGTIQLRQGSGYTQAPCPAVIRDNIYGIKILNEKDVVDLNDIEDDRIVITAKGCNPGAEMTDIQVNGQVVTVAPAVTNGGVNGLKIESFKAMMRNVQYTNAQYTGSPNGSYIASGGRVGSGDPFVALIFDKDSGMTDILVAHVRAANSEGIGVILRGGPGGEPMSVTFDDLTLTNSYGAACVRFAALSPPSGRDQVHVFNVTCSAAPEARARFGNGLYGALFLPTGGVPTNGVSGDVVIRNSRFIGYSRPILIYSGGGFKGALVDGVTWDTGTLAVDRSTILRNTAGPH
jgi:hypothetical protein